MKNKVSCEMFQEYQERFIELENYFFDKCGYYPLATTRDFWQDRVVKQTECLLILWWDLKEILSKRAV